MVTIATTPTVEAALADALATIRRTIPVMGTARPSIGLPDLTYARCNGWDWVDGFWTGQLWLAYAHTGDATFRAAARAQRPAFAERLAHPERNDHDLGFLFSLSAVADWALTGDQEARAMGLAAAEQLAARYNPVGRFIRAWNEWDSDTPEQRRRKPGLIIVDCMENLGLLFWASRQSGDSSYAEIARAHAATAARHLVRADGSTYHVFEFDPVSGAPLGGGTWQGYADESCWSRGQAWAIHGFAAAYAATGEPLFRDTARRVADYAIAHLPPDGVPVYDYLLPPEVYPYRDSSAGAVTAAGLLLLADALGPTPEAAGYAAAARHILAGLVAGYTTAGHPSAEGLLLQGASWVAAGRCDAMLPYGDYFYVEALLRALGRTQFFW